MLVDHEMNHSERVVDLTNTYLSRRPSEAGPISGGDNKIFDDDDIHELLLSSRVYNRFNFLLMHGNVFLNFYTSGFSIRSACTAGSRVCLI